MRFLVRWREYVFKTISPILPILDKHMFQYKPQGQGANQNASVHVSHLLPREKEHKTEHILIRQRLRPYNTLNTCSLWPIESDVLDSVLSYLTFILLKNFYININYFVTTILIIIYLLRRMVKQDIQKLKMTFSMGPRDYHLRRFLSKHSTL